MIKTVKFGGTSLADAEHVQKSLDIIKSDSARRFVVPSAPGKRYGNDYKVTDLLLRCFEIQKRDFEQGLELFSEIEDRYDAIIRGLGLDYSLEDEYRIIRARMEEGLSKDYLVSRGEYLSGLVLAKALSFPFVDPADYIFFDSSGYYDEKRTAAAFEELSEMPCFVMPGFYGTSVSGRTQTFPRGGSDITGSIVSKEMHVDIYENWTDVSGFLAADPHLIDDPEVIEEISYSEIRELSYMGAQVFHEEAIFPARAAGIPINIKNTNHPEDEGSWIVPDEKISEKHSFITGITGKRNFTSLSFEKDIGSDRLGFGRKILQMFEESKVLVDHVPSSIGVMTVLVDDAELSGKEESILRRIRREIDPYSISIERDLALVAIVGMEMRGVHGVTAAILETLAEKGIGTRMMIKSMKEISLILGVSEADFEPTIEALYKFSRAWNNVGGIPGLGDVPEEAQEQLLEELRVLEDEEENEN